MPHRVHIVPWLQLSSQAQASCLSMQLLQGIGTVLPG